MLLYLFLQWLSWPTRIALLVVLFAVAIHHPNFFYVYLFLAICDGLLAVLYGIGLLAAECGRGLFAWATSPSPPKPPRPSPPLPNRDALQELRKEIERRKSLVLLTESDPDVRTAMIENLNEQFRHALLNLQQGSP